MKKYLIKSIAILMAILFVFPATAYADDVPDDVEWYDLNMTEEEVDEFIAEHPNDSAQTRATGLINSYYIGLDATGTTLKIVAKTYGIASVVKAGFTEIVIQRRKNVTQSWSDYITYNDIYENTSSCVFSRGITVTSGYYYRATCVHYAKKNVLSVQKINNTSNLIGI